MTRPAPTLPDATARERFRSELDRSFSVLAPAGVGKTKSIVDRVLAIATQPADAAAAQLPRLVVVTYTRSAALEMHQRARNAIIAQGVGLPVLRAFNRSFFGTIHSLCLRLLQEHGHHIGLPAALDIAEDEDALWRDFERGTPHLTGTPLSPAEQRCLQLVPIDNLIAAARSLPGADSVDADAPGEPPPVDLAEILAFQPAKRSVATVGRAQALIRDWADAWAGGVHARLPVIDEGGRDFESLCDRAFAPLRAWAARATLSLARKIAAAALETRLARGSLTYTDMITMTHRLLAVPAARDAIRAMDSIVILDEAQDTDPDQFRILLELARPRDASPGVWLDAGGDPPAPGRFCMVGDPQQLIYPERADLAVYARVREMLVEAGGEELTFEVTFRCDRAIVDTVDSLGPSLLDGEGGQARFVPLRARPDATPGQVLRWDIPAPAEEVKKVGDVTLAEARHLARRIREAGLAALRAHRWSDVVLLCPRNRWFPPLQRALEDEGFRVQSHSEKQVNREDVVFAWYTALMVCAAEPDNAFEIVGLLREPFAISDDELARYADGDGSRFQILSPPSGDSRVADALRTLADARTAALALPLRDAANHLVRAARLRDRLCGWAPPAAVDSGLAGLATIAAAHEADGATLNQWADYLRERFDAPQAGRPVDPDAIQLMTNHKAKGLQWPCVIQPLLYRPVHENRPAYPMILRGAGRAGPTVLMTKADAAPVESAIEARRQQGLERLLYVALTRAQRTLVLVNDADSFRKSRLSMADALGLPLPDSGLEAPGWWTRLPAVASPGEPRESETPPPTAPAAEPAAVDPARARAASARFPRRVLPYALAEAVHADAEPEAALRDGDLERSVSAEIARAYGTWWHETVERIEWPLGADAVRSAFADALPACPDPDRGRAERDTLLASEIAAWLARPGLRHFREIPFLWPKSPDTCIEGIMDLAVLDPATGEWLVLDWKTNRGRDSDAESLQRLYAPQLGAYVGALAAVTGRPVRGALYSTASGRLVPIPFSSA